MPVCTCVRARTSLQIWLMRSVCSPSVDWWEKRTRIGRRLEFHQNGGVCILTVAFSAAHNTHPNMHVSTLDGTCDTPNTNVVQVMHACWVGVVSGAEGDSEYTHAVRVRQEVADDMTWRT